MKKVLKTAVFLTAVTALAAAASRSKKARLRDGKIDADMYIIGKKSNANSVYITNEPPLKAAIIAIKSYFTGNFFN